MSKYQLYFSSWCTIYEIYPCHPRCRLILHISLTAKNIHRQNIQRHVKFFYSSGRPDNPETLRIMSGNSKFLYIPVIVQIFQKHSVIFQETV